MPASIIIQHIVIEWNKSWRGVPGAELRNKVPEWRPLPGNVFDMAGGNPVIHRVVWSYRNQFACPAEEEVLHPARLGDGWIYECLEFRQTGENLRIWYEANASVCGAPFRNVRKALEIGEGEIAKIVTNGRFTIQKGSWLYRKQVFHIAQLPVKRPDVFEHVLPRMEFHDLHGLW
jgi:hypothetical protein